MGIVMMKLTHEYFKNTIKTSESLMKRNDVNFL